MAEQVQTQVIPCVTCPKIDKVIDALSSIGKSLDGAEKEIRGSEGELASYFSSTINEVQWELNGLSSMMEEIREANDILRGLGRDWYETAKWIGEQLEELAYE